MKKFLLLALFLSFPCAAHADDTLVQVFKKDIFGKEITSMEISPANYLVWAIKKYSKKNIFVVNYFADSSRSTNWVRVNFNRKTGRLYLLTNNPSRSKALKQFDTVTLGKLQQCLEMRPGIQPSVDDALLCLEDLNCEWKVIYVKRYSGSNG